MSLIDEANMIFRKRVTNMVKETNKLAGYNIISVRKVPGTLSWYDIRVHGKKRSSELTIKSAMIWVEGFLDGLTIHDDFTDKMLKGLPTILRSDKV